MHAVTERRIVIIINNIHAYKGTSYLKPSGQDDHLQLGYGFESSSSVRFFCF